jgi:hypothetical protein
MLIQELPCLDSNIASQLLLIEFCNKILWPVALFAATPHFVGFRDKVDVNQGSSQNRIYEYTA